jgi:putative transposase
MRARRQILHHPHSIRLKGYDYAQAGAYFVTICTQGRECLFGEIVDDEMQLSDVGRMVQTAWSELPDHYPGVETDAFVVMPNHIHGIIILTSDQPAQGPAPMGPMGRTADGAGVGAAPRGCPDAKPADLGPVRRTADGAGVGATPRGCLDAKLSLSDVVNRFKSWTTARYRHGVAQLGWPPFAGKLWQRNYYEHIVRNEEELGQMRQYVEGNPLKWALDRENPASGMASLREEGL